MTQRPLEGQRIAVTGATGFVGRATVRALADAGATPVAIVRSRHGLQPLRKAGSKIRQAPLVPGPRLAEVLRDVTAVCHLAYDVRASGAANLIAFDALLDAMKTAGVTRIVHMSSAVVYDAWPGGRISPDAPRQPDGRSDYRDTKIAMENRLRDGGWDGAILQPTIVYGTGSALWTEAPMAALRQGPVILPDPAGHCPALHVDDLASAVVAALVAHRPGMAHYPITGPDMPDWPSLYAGYAALIGTGQVAAKPAAALAERLGPAPDPGQASPSGPSLAAQVSRVGRAVLGRSRFEAMVALAKRLAARGKPVYPDRGHLALYEARPEISSAAAQSDLGWTPEVDFRAGLERIQRELGKRR